VKARKVKGLDPEGTLADNLETIVRVRLAELYGFMPEASDPSEVQALHDLRIAAKRLRYILEIADGCFGPYAAMAAKRAKELQDLVGEIHDCDVTIPRVRALIDQARAADADAVLARADPAAEDLEAQLAADAPHADAYRGLETMVTFLSARRALLFARFGEFWTRLEREGFRSRLQYAIAERPAARVTPASPAGNAEIVGLAVEPT
jgi:hypothetical protein